MNASSASLPCFGAFCASAGTAKMAANRQTPIPVRIFPPLWAFRFRYYSCLRHQLNMEPRSDTNRRRSPR